MKNAFAGKISYFILTFVFLIIIASFLFTGFDGGAMGGGSNVASVDGTPITIKEYQTALNRQVEFFNQMMGGSGMTQKQLEEMGIKQSVLNGLVQQKLILNTADQMGFVVSLDEVKNEIKSMPYFKTNNQFDVNLYRNMLQGNGYVPTQFEELVGNDLKQKKIDELFNSLIVSENYVQDITKFKNNKVVVQGVKIGRQALAPLISISEDEVKEYLAKPENEKALEMAYTENISNYNKPAELKARHILLSGDDPKTAEEIKTIRNKVTPKNFAEIATKMTEDPTGKANGGDLGWFSAGRMVPEFEKVAFNMKKGEISQPVKTQFGYHLIYLEDKKAPENKSLESVRSELARMEIQKTKAQDLDKLLQSTAQEIQAALGRNDFSKVEALAKKVDGQLYQNAEVNQFDQSLETTNLAPQEASQIFTAAPGTVLDFGNPGTIFLVKVVSKKAEAGTKSSEQLQAEVTSQNQLLSRKVRDELIKTMNNKAKVVTNPGLL
jgi:peptidyl-prolyl cis-trans isomerase D